MNYPTFSPQDLASLSQCTLQFHFSQRRPVVANDHFWREAVQDTIRHLHAQGGPNRLNLPATLRYLEQGLADQAVDDVVLTMAARQMLAHYHRRLRTDWPLVMASDEQLNLNLRLPRQIIRLAGQVDRVDRAEDGGVTAVFFKIERQAPPTEDSAPPDEEMLVFTLIHALLAAAYPQRRPVRLKQLWLFTDQVRVWELQEEQYRQDLDMVRRRAQAWLDGEVLARPGLHCDTCPFKYQGCPVFIGSAAEDPA